MFGQRFRLSRAVAIVSATAFCAAAAGLTAAEPEEPPLRYDVTINGENFTVEAGRSTKLNSKDHPGTVYELAVQVAELQRWTLNSVQFDYHVSFQLSDDHKRDGRTAKLEHPLGFVATVTDLGAALPADSRSSALKLLVESMQRTLGDSDTHDLTVGKPQQRKFGNNSVEAVTIHYKDSHDAACSSVVYLITGNKFACSCLLQCADEDRANALDLLKPTLESLRPL